ncbi:apolipoprotein N-acyltransferase [Spirochaeta lutea]|uniref:Apolipoprotein N-acyltransferase n=1 Tax=Spirochaeta lutea TaxID=1480694 RepID=A0A098QVU4_9SPIO|nr:apolipoprotein N-acyltransferase [Spirochaeta lutea]KGE71970.1 hypothetical protein DC28_09255 [Spirochaeta lutea]
MKASLGIGMGYVAAAWWAVIALGQRVVLNDLFLLGVILLHALYGIYRVMRSLGEPMGQDGRESRLGMDALMGAALVSFLFSYFFALTANLDYVQRFQLGSDALNLAVDSGEEQRIVIFRYLPLGVAYLWGLLFRHGGRWWAFPLLLASTVVHALAFPSRFFPQGIGPLIFIAYVPLFFLLSRVKRFGQWWVYGMFWGLVSTMLRNYWLGTYSLVTLQGVVLVFIVRFGLFFLVGWPVFRAVAGLAKRRPWAAALPWLFWAMAITLFEYWASHSWVGYPWTLTAHALYRWPEAIQFAGAAGVWGVSFLVLVVNAGLAWAIQSRDWRPGAAVLGIFGINVLIGVILMPPVHPAEGEVATYYIDPDSGSSRPRVQNSGRERHPEAVRLALVQQNTDPRKNDYDVTLDTLITLSDIGLRYDPDLVAWSETAFVPNIRRWSQVPPSENRLARTVDRFLKYQEGMGTYLITGNDDYQVVRNDQGQEIDRINYNATIMFSDAGERLQTYHKMVLVPLTETFPYEDFFPGWFYDLFPGVEGWFAGLLDLLERLDVNLWGEGVEYVQFEHPDFRFSTPICFEDAFAYHVRDFVLAGSDMIVNLSNDYWSLDEVEAQQHFATGLFRTVENRVPMARATASGVTGYIDAYGRLLTRIPNYVEGVVVVDTLPGRQGGMTLYTRWGDWFPILLAWLILIQVGGYVGAGLWRWIESGRGEKE